MSETSNRAESETGRGAVVDILLIVAASAVAYGIELALQEVLPWGDEARGLLAVLVGAVAAIAITLRRGRSLADLGFRRPASWWTAPAWVAGIFVTFVVAQNVVPVVIGSFFDFPQPDMSRYDFIRGNLPAALAMALLLPLTAAVPEEIVYRGFLIERLTRLFGTDRKGMVLAVLLQAIIFGFVHFEWGPGGILMTTIMGAVWGFAFLMCGRNLWIVILAHSAAHVALVALVYSS